MAKDLLFSAGFEFGSAFSRATGTGGVAGTGVEAGSIVTGQYGRYGRQLQHDSHNRGYDSNVSSVGLGGSNVGTLIARVYFAVSQLPAAGKDTLVLSFTPSTGAGTGGKGFAIRMKPDGTMEAGYRAADTSLNNGAFVASGAGGHAENNGPQVSAKLCAQHWHRIDAFLDVTPATGAWVLKWSINGVAQADATVLSGGAATWARVQVGSASVYTDDAAQSGILYTDDFAISATTAHYPIGPGRTVLIVPNADGTNGGNAARFQNEDGTAVDTTTVGRIGEGSFAGAWTPLPAAGTAKGSAGDGHAVEHIGPFNTADFRRYLFEPISLDSGNSEQVGCLTCAFSTYVSNPAPTIQMDTGFSIAGQTLGDSFKFSADLTGKVDSFMWGDGATSGATGVDIASRIDIPTGGGWTEARVNDLRILFGVRSNAAGDAATKYFGLSWVGVEVHILGDKEPQGSYGNGTNKIGCFLPRLPLLGVG